MVLIVIFRKRKDRILGSTFFAISFYLGVIEIATFPINHFFLLMPNNGILVDEIYTRIGGLFPYLCSYSTFSVNTIQYMVISVCSFNRFVVIVGSYSRKVGDFFIR
uniref:Uncharacterized protein n=1 Tax=Acrobeloides nanus TaxID=290746 RepID=A0A914CKL7_9BILA